MKKILLLVLLPSITFAQFDFDGELRFFLTNSGSSWNVTIKLTAIGARWDANNYLTQEYEIISSGASNPKYYIAFNHIKHPGINPAFAVGLYKISAIENGVEQAYFYMDWRTSYYCVNNEDPDVQFSYDVTNNIFLYNTLNINSSYQTFWNLTENLFITSGLENYWENCLVSLPIGGGHPNIYWGRHPLDDVEFEVDNYKIYRAVSSGLPPPNPNYTSIATVGSDIYSFIDYDFATGGPLSLQYRVTAVYEDLAESVYETIPTNSVLISGGLYKDYSEVDEKIEFYLSDNYPNPFNPTTTINYTIESSGLVILNIYDVLGTNVATLVNEIKEAGNHSVKFNAENLPSGIYFYELNAGGFVQTKKMNLMK